MSWLSIDERRASHIETGVCSLTGLSKLSHGYKMSLTCGGHEPEDKRRRATEIWSLAEYRSEKFLTIYYPNLGVIAYRKCK